MQMERGRVPVTPCFRVLEESVGVDRSRISWHLRTAHQTHQHMPESQGCENGPEATAEGRWGRGRRWWLMPARVCRVGRQGRVAPDPSGGKVTRLDELVGRMRPGLEQRV